MKLITSTNIEWYTYIQWVRDSNGQMRINMGDNGIKGCETILTSRVLKIFSMDLIFFLALDCACRDIW